MTYPGNNDNSCVVLYSGGTDSTCTAAVLTEKYSEIHLLSFYQGNKKRNCKIDNNIISLQGKFTQTKFIHRIISTTKLVKFISYNKYFKYLYRYKYLILSTCGFTTFSWHINAIIYCHKNNIKHVADGLTKELMHFPGHMDAVINIFKKLYNDFGIEYNNPVRNWEVPLDQQFIDRLIVNQHGFLFPSEESQAAISKTTGKYLYDLGILPDSNVKGSPLDHRMQYDCYPFVLYNIMVFWIYLNFGSYENLCNKMRSLFQDKINDIKPLLKDYVAGNTNSKMAKLLDIN